MRSLIDDTRARNLIMDGAAKYNMTSQAISATVNLTPNAPYYSALDPGVTTQKVIMYTPPPGAVAICHEVANIAAATGVINIRDPGDTTTLGSVAIGKRAEVVWNPKTSTWSVFLSA
jgi:hypothetical protein